MNLKTREKRSRGIGTALVIINFVINVFWTFFSAASRCRYASRLLLILSCSWFSYSQLSPKVLMWNCENVFNVLNVSSVKSRSLHSFPRARHSHRLWLVAVVLQSKMKPKQIVPISIFLKNSFILQHPTQGRVGQLVGSKGKHDWGRYPASEKCLFAF